MNDSKISCNEISRKASPTSFRISIVTPGTAQTTFLDGRFMMEEKQEGRPETIYLSDTLLFGVKEEICGSGRKCK